MAAAIKEWRNEGRTKTSGESGGHPLRVPWIVNLRRVGGCRRPSEDSSPGPRGKGGAGRTRSSEETQTPGTALRRRRAGRALGSGVREVANACITPRSGSPRDVRTRAMPPDAIGRPASLLRTRSGCRALMDGSTNIVPTRPAHRAQHRRPARWGIVHQIRSTRGIPGRAVSMTGGGAWLQKTHLRSEKMPEVIPFSLVVGCYLHGKVRSYYMLKTFPTLELLGKSNGGAFFQVKE